MYTMLVVHAHPAQERIDEGDCIGSIREIKTSCSEQKTVVVQRQLMSSFAHPVHDGCSYVAVGAAHDWNKQPFHRDLPQRRYGGMVLEGRLKAAQHGSGWRELWLILR